MPITLKLEIEITEQQRDVFVNALAGEALRNTGGKTPVINDDATPVTSAPVTQDVSDDVDAAGIPWNPDFHASTKGANADGTWKKKRGHDKVALEAYEASFKIPVLAPVVAPDEPSVVTPVVPTVPVVTPVVETPAEASVVMPQVTQPTAPVTMQNVVNVYNELVTKFGDEYMISKMPGIYQSAGVSSDGGSLHEVEQQRATVVQLMSELNGS